MTLYPVVKIAIVLGGLGAIGGIVARLRVAWWALPIVVFAALGVAFSAEAMRWDFLWSSILWDAPWRSAVPLAVWCAFGASGTVRTTSWPGVIVATALLGDVVVATGLALAEPDAGRRARLVLAASGASIIGPWSGATVFTLGCGGLEMSALGLALALIGFTRGRGENRLVRPSFRLAWPAAAVVVSATLLVWLMAAGSVADFASFGLEGLAPLLPGRATEWVGVLAALIGAVVYEPAAALFLEHTLALATKLRGTWAVDALRIGVSVGAGLPMLLLSGAQLRVGLPLWVLQVCLAVGYLAVVYHV
ncbi:MAG: hypothetical protein EXR71_03755 [Myxococcales bacterium]|nr:hypothetical protein [Myxococcales bacterium]